MSFKQSLEADPPRPKQARKAWQPPILTPLGTLASLTRDPKGPGDGEVVWDGQTLGPLSY